MKCQQNLVEQARSEVLDEEKIWFTWSLSGTQLIGYRGTEKIPEVEKITLDTLHNNGCLSCVRGWKKLRRFLKREQFERAESRVGSEPGVAIGVSSGGVRRPRILLPETGKLSHSARCGLLLETQRRYEYPTRQCFISTTEGVSTDSGDDAFSQRPTGHTTQRLGRFQRRWQVEANLIDFDYGIYAKKLWMNFCKLTIVG